MNWRAFLGEAVVCNFPGSDESKRARRLREAMGFNGRGGQQKFAELLGVGRGRWNNVECGAPLGKEMALRIVRKYPGVTLDWLFLGRTEGLTVEMARVLSGPSKGNDADGDSPSSLGRLSPPAVLRRSSDAVATSREDHRSTRSGREVQRPRWGRGRSPP